MPFPFSDDSTVEAQKAAPHIDTVLFDYGMVLSGPPDPAAWTKLRAIASLDEERLHAAYWDFRRDYDRGTLTGHAYWKAVAARTGITLDDATIAKILPIDVDLWTKPNPPMIEWAQRLQRAGIRTGILSNIGDAIAEGIVAKLPWLSRFDHCTWSHALFMAKPEPAIYIKTAEALHTAPANILFIDDREENIVAAQSLGMQAFHFTDFTHFEHEMRERGFASLLDVGMATEAAVKNLTGR